MAPSRDRASGRATVREKSTLERIGKNTRPRREIRQEPDRSLPSQSRK